MKKTLLFAIAMALGISTTAFAANPFSDVPAGHWSYAAVAQLAADGVVTGYPDGTFKGDTTMTRYEMAQIVAKALSKGTIDNNDALVAEFADELDNLGVRVTKLEKKSDNVKLTGSLRYRYFSHNNGDTDQSELRSRIGVAGAINDNWTYNALIENDKNLGHDIDSDTDDTTEFRRAWVSGNVGEVAVDAGRFNYTVLNGNVFDDEMDGANLKFAAAKNVDVALAYGRQDGEDTSDNLFIGTVGTSVGAIKATAAYYNQEQSAADDTSIYTVGLATDIAKDLTLSGTYLKADAKNENGDDDGYAIGLNYKGAEKNTVGSYGVYAMYNNQPDTTYIAHTTDANTFSDISGAGGWKGTTVGVDYTVAKNMIATVNYFDTEALATSDDDQVIMSQLYMFF